MKATDLVLVGMFVLGAEMVVAGALDDQQSSRAAVGNKAAASLTQAQLKARENRLFARADSDRDGKLTRAELKASHERLHHAHKLPS
jgi:hypothetical protein